MLIKALDNNPEIEVIVLGVLGYVTRHILLAIQKVLSFEFLMHAFSMAVHCEVCMIYNGGMLTAVSN